MDLPDELADVYLTSRVIVLEPETDVELPQFGDGQVYDLMRSHEESPFYDPPDGPPPPPEFAASPIWSTAEPDFRGRAEVLQPGQEYWFRFSAAGDQQLQEELSSFFKSLMEEPVDLGGSPVQVTDVVENRGSNGSGGPAGWAEFHSAAELFEQTPVADRVTFTFHQPTVLRHKSDSCYLPLKTALMSDFTFLVEACTPINVDDYAGTESLARDLTYPDYDLDMATLEGNEIPESRGFTGRLEVDLSDLNREARKLTSFMAAMVSVTGVGDYPQYGFGQTEVEFAR